MRIVKHTIIMETKGRYEKNGNKWTQPVDWEEPSILKRDDTGVHSQTLFTKLL